MGFSSIFGKAKGGLTNIAHGFTGKGRTGFFSVTQKWNRSHQKRGGYSGGWAAIAFGNIINAHSSAEEIVETFSLNKEENSYGCDAYERSYSEQHDIAEQIYNEWVDYYLGLIDILTSEMNALNHEADELESTAQDLQNEAQMLRDEAEWTDDPDEVEELLDEAEMLEQEAQELLEQAQALRLEATELQLEIDEYYSEIDFLTIEQFIDEEIVENNALLYACEFAQEWIDGNVWIPIDVLSWAFYQISDHNN